MGGLYCTRCRGTLVVRLTDGKCSCPRGKYANATATGSGGEDAFRCLDCEKGAYCAGGVYEAGVDQTGRDTCPSFMTTLGRRTETVRGCVNLPGYSYSITSVNGLSIVSAERCPVNTYSPGLKKQRACVPCPTGFTTKGLDGRTRPEDCIIPAGYYLKAPGQVAPCPRGEWKAGEGPSGNCTKCAFGVTTKLEGSTLEQNCTDVVPGRYASAISGVIVQSTQICPQKYYCQGGTPAMVFNPATPGTLNATIEDTIKICPEGTWTQDLGATDPDQCMTPPGFKTSNGNTTQCADNEYRADWKPLNQATNCLSCGSGVFATKTDRLKVYNITDPEIITYEPITSSSDDCYILPGQGLYYSTITGSWRARNCDSDSYGVSNITYGLTPAPCRDCPSGMTAVNNATTFPNSTQYYYGANSALGAEGFISALACVTKAGFGYNGRIAQECDQGTYNAADTRSTCTPCSYGFTTNGVGVGITEADCGPAAGFGYYNVSGTPNLVPCPIGTYNNKTWDSNDTAICTTCPTGLTTQREGSNSDLDCNMCSAGYGGASCATQCGGTGTDATYGPPGRGIASPTCLNCSFASTGFSFEYNLTNLVYAPRAVSRVGANFSGDCLTEYTQVEDKAWQLKIVTPLVTAGNIATATAATFADCLALCTDNCAFATYNYDAGASNCEYVSPSASYVGDYYIGWKVGPSGDIGTSAFAKYLAAKNMGKTNRARNVWSSGFFVWYQDPNARNYGTLVAASTMNTTAITTVQDCLNICDDDSRCAGVTFDNALAAGQTSAECMLVYGNNEIGRFKRTMLRTTLSRLTRPVGLKD